MLKIIRVKYKQQVEAWNTLILQSSCAKNDEGQYLCPGCLAPEGSLSSRQNGVQGAAVFRLNLGMFGIVRKIGQ